MTAKKVSRPVTVLGLNWCVKGWKQRQALSSPNVATSNTPAIHLRERQALYSACQRISRAIDPSQWSAKDGRESMTLKRADAALHELGRTGALRSWIMILLTLALVLLYVAALIGWIKPLVDEKMALRLEPIIFVIIGYCFGRLPAQQNEQTLKEEINRHAQKVDAVQHAKEKALEALAALEEKVKNVTAAVAPVASRKQLDERSGTPRADDKLNGSLVAALEILNS